MPFLYVDSSGNYWVFSPGLRTNSSGTSWSGGGLGTGNSLAISTFFIATPSSTLAQINAALSSGQNLILTPGIYQYSGSINVVNANTVVLGIGYPTLVPQTGTAAITVADVDGVQVAGVLIDAGPVNSPVLFEVGVAGGSRVSHASNPTSISDTFFRIGGATAGTATTALEIDSDNVILDNIWAWRADHGTGVGWTSNVADHGLVVNGDDVTALGLAVEHYEQNQVVWNGQGGETIFYQSELPYDPPSQSAWMNGSVDGYASYSVSDSVTSHTAYGLGVYSLFNQGVNIVETSAITVPNVAGVQIIDAMTWFIGDSGSITHIVNSTGAAVNSGSKTSYLTSYGSPGGGCTAAPSVPGTPSATATSSSQINLTWGASTAGSSCTVSYNVFSSTTSGFTPSSSNQIATGVTTTSYSNTSLTASTTYYYKVEASDSFGASAASAQASATTQSGSSGGTQLIAINAGGPAASPFVADEDFSGGSTIDHANTINTSNVTNPAPEAVYQTGRDTSAVGPGTTFTYTIGGFTAGTDYLVRLHFCETYFTASGMRTFDVSINGTQVLTNFDIFATAGGENIANIQQFTEPANSSGQFVIVFTSVVNNALVSGIEIDSTSGSCTAPTAPSGLAATVVSPTQNNLSWTASTSSCAVTYDVFRGTTSGFTPSSSNEIASSVTATSYSDTGVTPGTTYYYVVEGTNSGGTSGPSNQATATTQSCSIPTAPSGLTATDVSSSQISLSWTASTSSCSGITYDVFRSTTSGFTPSTSDEILSGVTTTTYSDTGLAASTTYYYLIEGTNLAGTSAASNQASATTSASSGSCSSICINSGGPAVSPFVADEDFTGGATVDHANTINTSKVTNPAPAAVYQTGRDGNFTYTIPGFTAGSMHTVRLHFCETYFTASGKRTFNVSINGTQVLTAFDIFATAGGQNIANIQQFSEAANSSGQYVIQFTSVVNNSLVSGIEID